MSQENVEIVKAAFAAFERDDLEGVLSYCDEDVAIMQDAALPGVPAQQRGHAGVLEAFTIWPDLWDDFRVEIVSVSDHGDRVMFTTLNRGRGKDSGVPVEMAFTYLFALRGGKITEWRIFMREEQALEALGPAE
jgi:ketosteroid isomerase-like protein